MLKLATTDTLCRLLENNTQGSIQLLNHVKNFLYKVCNKYKEERKIMMDGFTHYEGNAVLWTVYHNQGTTFVHATSEAIALQRFMAKYPDRVVKKIVRG